MASHGYPIFSYEHQILSTQNNTHNIISEDISGQLNQIGIDIIIMLLVTIFVCILYENILFKTINPGKDSGYFRIGLAYWEFLLLGSSDSKSTRTRLALLFIMSLYFVRSFFLGQVSTSLVIMPTFTIDTFDDLVNDNCDNMPIAIFKGSFTIRKWINESADSTPSKLRAKIAQLGSDHVFLGFIDLYKFLNNQVIGQSPMAIIARGAITGQALFKICGKYSYSGFRLLMGDTRLYMSSKSSFNEVFSPIYNVSGVDRIIKQQRLNDL